MSKAKLIENSKSEKDSSRFDTVTLYEEYRLIEKDLSEINGAWRELKLTNAQNQGKCERSEHGSSGHPDIRLEGDGGGSQASEANSAPSAIPFGVSFYCDFVTTTWGIHLLLFFLAFVFGSFCTFCFHMLMFLFDEKCVLFPKLISLKEMSSKSGSNTGDKSTSKQLIYDYISDTKDTLPVDFVATHWVEQKTCYLPTYAPLLSGICGLIWTTMFLMCSSGSRALTGLQRAWRILPTVFIFSVAMSGLSIYTSFITQSGLEELCLKLAEITGSKRCSYTINVATLAYERRIRGVYQATRLTVMSAWIHTLCWIGSAFTALLRIILIVDFRLVKVQVQLRGNIEKMLERHEKHIRTDEFSSKDEQSSPRRLSNTSLKVRFVNKGFGTEPPSNADTTLIAGTSRETLHFLSQASPYTSEMALVPDECRKLIVKSAAIRVAKKHRFIIELLHGIVDNIGTEPSPVNALVAESVNDIKRQQGVRNVQSLVWTSSSSSEKESIVDQEEAEQLAKKFRHILEHKGTVENFKLMTPATLSSEPFAVGPKQPILKSRLSNRGVQTEEVKKQTVSQKVQISSPKASVSTLKPVTLDLLKPSVKQESNENISSMITPQPPDLSKKEIKPTKNTVEPLDKENNKAMTSTTDTLTPPLEKQWQETLKDSEYRFEQKESPVEHIIKFTKSVVESVANNEDTMVVRAVNTNEKISGKILDATVEKDDGKSPKDIPLLISSKETITNKKLDVTVDKDDGKSPKAIPHSISSKETITDKKLDGTIENDNDKSPKDLPFSITFKETITDKKLDATMVMDEGKSSKESPPSVSPKETIMGKKMDSTVEKDEDKTPKDLLPSKVKEEPGPSQTKDEPDQREDIRREKPKKTDRKEKQD